MQGVIDCMAYVCYHLFVYSDACERSNNEYQDRLKMSMGINCYRSDLPWRIRAATDQVACPAPLLLTPLPGRESVRVRQS